MLIGALLILTWLVLLLRYPAKALSISLSAVLGLGLRRVQDALDPAAYPGSRFRLGEPDRF